jgi:sporulation protein YlmC with PRC-barrel domain
MENLPKDNYSGKFEGKPYPNVPLRYLAASSIIGDKVHDEQGKPMGKIEDIMIDVVTGTIDYVVVEFGGFLTIGTKYFAIPFKLLRVDPDKRMFVFKGSKEKLVDAPGFDLAHWPDTNFHKEETYWHFMD